jgi:hypothetical protein
MPVRWSDLLLAFEFVSGDGTGEHQAFVCKQTGKLYWCPNTVDEMSELPENMMTVKNTFRFLLDLGKAARPGLRASILAGRLR